MSQQTEEYRDYFYIIFWLSRSLVKMITTGNQKSFFFNLGLPFLLLNTYSLFYFWQFGYIAPYLTYTSLEYCWSWDRRRSPWSLEDRISCIQGHVLKQESKIHNRTRHVSLFSSQWFMVIFVKYRLGGGLLILTLYLR